MSRWGPAYWVARSLRAIARWSSDDTECQDTAPHSRDIFCPSLVCRSPPQENRGHREDRVHAAPAVSCAMCTKDSARTSIQVWLRHPGLPCAMALRLIRARPGETLLLCHHHPRSAFGLSQTCHQHRGGRPTRLRRTPHARFAWRAVSVHRIFTHVRGVGERPSCRVRRKDI